MQGVDRCRRIGERIQRELANLLRDVKDPGVSPLITISHVDVSRDLSNARVFYSLLGAEADERTQAGLERAAGHLRSGLARMMPMKKTPRLEFQYDLVRDRANRMETLLAGLRHEGEGVSTDVS